MALNFDEGFESRTHEEHLPVNDPKPLNLIDTTDCLEAVSVFKNRVALFFLIICCCLVVLQLLFWFVHSNLVVISTNAESRQQQEIAQQQAVVVEEPTQIEQAAKEVVADVNQVAQAPAVEEEQAAHVEAKTEEQSEQVASPRQFKSFTATPGQIHGVVRLFNFILCFAAIMYVLSILFCMKLSVVARLGGIHHITRAFFLSLIFLVLLLPWQLFGDFLHGMFGGYMYLPSELLQVQNQTINTVSEGLVFYFRFVLYWLILFVILGFTCFRTSSWSRTILKRLEVI